MYNPQNRNSKTDVLRNELSVKSQDISQVSERLVSTLEHEQVPNWTGTGVRKRKAFSVCMPRPLQMLNGNLLESGQRSILVPGSH